MSTYNERTWPGLEAGEGFSAEGMFKLGSNGRMVGKFEERGRSIPERTPRQRAWGGWEEQNV